MPKRSPNINLLKTGRVNIADKVIAWALTIGRLVVITTELIALFAFGYRFILDRELIDLHSKIKQEQAIIEFYKNNEENYRNLQDRLTVASTFANQATKKNKVFGDLVGFTPSGIVFTNLSISENKIRINAITDSVISLSAFIKSLKNYPLVNNLSVDKIENKPSTSLINFSVSVTLKEDGVKK